MKKIKTLSLCLFFLIGITSVNAQTYVNKAATGANNGTSWANAYTDLQPAIDAATVGNEIWVAAGTYLPTKDHTGNSSPTNPRDKNFHLDTDMKIYGGFAGTETLLSQRDPVANVTILSGDFNGNDVVTGSGSTLTFANNSENAYHVIITASLTSAAILDGFTVKGSNANGASNVIYTNSYNRNSGGGMINVVVFPNPTTDIVTLKMENINEPTIQATVLALREVY